MGLITYNKDNDEARSFKFNSVNNLSIIFSVQCLNVALYTNFRKHCLMNIQGHYFLTFDIIVSL